MLSKRKLDSRSTRKLSLSISSFNLKLRPRSKTLSCSDDGSLSARAVQHGAGKDTRNPREALLFEYQLLLDIFVGFPPAMMKALIIREEGNTTEVSKYLIYQGWAKPCTLMECLSSTPNLHFSVPYFWGTMKEEYSSTLQKHKIGSFFTALQEPNSYHVFFLNKVNATQHFVIESPLVSEYEKILWSLKHPLKRFRQQNVQLEDLVTFLA